LFSYINAYLCLSFNAFVYEKKSVFMDECLISFVSVSLAQDIPAGLSIAFKKGNSQELSNYLGSKVT
jgi:hypothetical protein